MDQPSMESMKLPVTRRRAEESDTEFARTIHHKAFHDLIVRQFGEWDEKFQDDFFNEDWKPDAFEIIKYGDSDCGYCSIVEEQDAIRLQEFAVSPDFQGRGIGSKVLETLIQKARSENKPIRLEVLRENEARHLYQKYGFKDVGSTETHFNMEFDPTAE